MKDYPLYETTVFENFRIMCENVRKRVPDKNAFVYREKPTDENVVKVTFAEVREDVRNFGTALVELGCREERCAIVGASTLGWIYSYFAVMAIGGVTVPIDKELGVEDIGGIIEKAGCKFVFYGSEISDKIAELKKTLAGEIKWICMNGAALDGDDTRRMITAHGADLYEAGDNTYYDYEIDEDALASIVFTSGTTGKGKGVMLSQRNIVSDMTQGMYLFQITYKTMCTLPLHHTYGSTVNLVGHYSQGAEIYLSSGLKYFLKEMKEQQPTHLVLVPLFVETIYKKIWATAEKNGQAKLLRRMMKVSNGIRHIGIDMRKKMFKSILSMLGGKVEMIICGGAALNQDIIDTFEAIGITILNGYGITECAPLISCNRNKLQKSGSVGIPIIGELVKIDDPDENGEGEICVKGTNVMLGYYKDPDATAAVFDDEGYFHTGDYGKLDDDGWIYITGRLKNLIIFSNGKNVYPEEIENKIQGIYGVAEVVVYAGASRSNPDREVIVAEIFPDFEALELRNITDPETYFKNKVAEVNKTMVSYKAVGHVKIRKTEFQKNTSKKITRFNIDKTID
ncbi:MAG: AMP-binding protein [Clostridia bacterium]|nr:AMP-binding protein [Clostridia bacterium]